MIDPDPPTPDINKYNAPSNINPSDSIKHTAKYSISTENEIHHIFIYGNDREREPIGFFSLSNTDLEIFQTWTIETLKRFLSEKICKYYDTQELLNRLKSDPNLRPKETLSANNIKLLNEEYAIVNPALDILPDGSLFITQSQFVERLKTRIVKKVANGKKIEESEVYTIKEPVNITYTSRGEFFETVTPEFEKRNLYAKIPSDLIPGRWSIKSRMDFLNGRAPQIDPYILFNEVKGVFNDYIDFSNVKGAPALNASYTVLTYVHFIFDTIPYLKFEGEPGSGKSKSGQIHSLLDFNGVLNISATPASLFRTIEEERPTLVIDELENADWNNETFQALLPILNAGYNRLAKVTRIEGDGASRKRVKFSAYGPKIICAINPVLTSLASRSYVIHLIKSLDPIKANLEIKETNLEWQTIRDKLYLFAMQNYSKIQEFAKNGQVKNTLNLTGREWQKAFPLLTIAYYVAQFAPDKEGKDLVSDIINFITQTTEEKSGETANSWEADIIYVVLRKAFKELEELNENKRTMNTIVTVPQLDITLEVAERQGFDTNSPKFNKMSYNRKMAFKMRNMGLTIKTVTGAGNYASMETNLKHILDTIIRYNIQIPDINTNDLTNIINLTNLTNLTEKLKKWVTLVSSVSLVSLEGDGGEKNNDNLGWDYYRVKIGFSYTFEKAGETQTVICKEGEVRKLSNTNAILHRAYVEKACSNGHWDPNSRECIVDMGADNNE